MAEVSVWVYYGGFSNEEKDREIEKIAKEFGGTWYGSGTGPLPMGKLKGKQLRAAVKKVMRDNSFFFKGRTIEKAREKADKFAIDVKKKVKGISDVEIFEKA